MYRCAPASWNNICFSARALITFSHRGRTPTVLLSPRTVEPHLSKRSAPCCVTKGLFDITYASLSLFPCETVGPTNLRTYYRSSLQENNHCLVNHYAHAHTSLNARENRYGLTYLAKNNPVRYLQPL
jgi:hypothetical protein